MRVILFNFYPYRERRETASLRRYLFGLLGTATAAVVFTVAVTQELQARLDSKSAYLNELEGFKAQVAEQVEQTKDIQARVEVLSRQVQVLKSIERESIQVSHWLSFFEQTKPASVNLSRIHTQNGALQLHGATTTVEVLANWIDKMEVGNALFDSVGLIHVLEQDSSSELEAQEESRSHEFSLLASPRKEGI